MSDPFPYNQAGTRRVVFRTAGDRIQEYWLDDTGTWFFKDLTAASGAPLCTSRPEAYLFGDSRSVVFRVGAHLYEILSNNGTWTSADLTASASGPHATGSPACYVIGDIRQVVYKGGDGHLHEILKSDYLTEWHDNDLTIASGNSPMPSGNAAVCRSAEGFRYVIYLGKDHHVHMLKWEATWAHTDLTGIAGAPRAAEVPSVYTDGFDHAFIYRDAAGHIYELRPDGSWEDITLLVPGSPTAAGRPYGFMDGATRCIIFRAVDDRIYSLTCNGSWGLDAGMAASGCPAAVDNPRGYAVTGGRYVVFKGTDGHLYELKLESGVWSYTDLSAVAVQS